jgi:hypothetical protein
MSMIERRDLREQKQGTAATPNINTVFAYNVLALVAVLWLNITNNINDRANHHVRMFICARDINVIPLALLPDHFFSASAGALAAVRATIARMQSAAAAAAEADRQSLESALERSSLGHVPVQPPPPHPFLANLMKQEQELVCL